MRNDERLRTIYEVMAPYIVRNEHNWRDYLAFASQFHKHSFDNILLVYAQDEDVSILATRKQWAAIGRNLIPRAKGVAVCVYRNAKLTLDYLFDVSQTTGKEIHPTDWQLSDEMKEALTERLSYAHGFPKQGFSQALYALASESVADNYNHFLQELKQETKGHLFTEIPAGGFEAQYIQLLTDSISYFIGKKCHLPDEEIQLSDGMATVSHFNTLPLVAHLGTAVTALSKGILLEVERNIKIINRERMAQHEQTEYQSEIQGAGRDDASRSANLQQQRSRSTSGQVRPDGPGIPQRESPGAIYDFENGWQSDGDHAPGTGRGDREDRSPDPANAPAGADPADRGHHGADAPPEQSETDGGGNRTPERSPDSPLTEEHPNTEAAPSAAPVGEPSEKDGSFSVPAEQPTRHFTDAEVRRNYEYILTSTNLYPPELHSAVRSVLSEPPLNPDWSDKGRQIAALFTPYGDREYQGDFLYRTRLHGEDGISFFFDEGYTYIPWNGLAFLLDAMIEDGDYPNPVVEEQPDPIGDYNIPDEVDEMGGPHRQMTIGEADFDYVLDAVAYEAGETVVEPVKPQAIVQMENDTPAAGDEPASVPDENPPVVVEAPETALPTDTAEQPTPPPVKGNTTAHKNFRRFQELFPEIVSGQYEYLRLEAGEAYYPLVIHHKYGSHYCMEHYYMQNGDRMYDPYMDFQIDKEAGTLRAFSYENSGIGVYNEANPDDPAYEKAINGFNSFFATWLNNIRSQGYEPVRASMMVNDEEVDVDLRPAAEAVPVVEEEQPEQLSLLSLEKSTEDLLVERVMQRGPLTAGKKEQIYEFAQTHPTGSEFTAFLKKLYGYEGFSGDEMGVKYAMFNSEGVTIEWQDEQGETQETKLSWARAAGVVQRLVDEGRYLETPVVSQTEQQNEVQPFSDQYRLLDRLCADCEYFLGAGQRAEKHLWAGSVDAQIEKMRELYAQLPEKPDWISLDVINAYARRMAAPEPVENTAEASPEETQILDEALDAHHGQIDMLMQAVRGELTVGTIRYSIFEGRPHISMIEVLEDYRRQGIATQMLRYLQGQYPNEEIVWGYNDLNPYIHDYFFIKSLDLAKPGGIIAFITSKGIMDRKDESLREYIARRAEFIGAIRLPNTAFKALAGTDVTADVVFLKKRAHPIELDRTNLPSWIETDLDRSKWIAYNRYFKDNPEMLMGEMVSSRNMYGNEDGTACVAPEDFDLNQHLTQAVDSLYARFTAEPDEEIEADEPEESNAEYEDAPAGTKNFTYVVRNGEIFFCEKDKLIPQPYTGMKAERIKGLCEIRTALLEVINIQSHEYDPLDLQKAQDTLNQVYDRFVAKYGAINSKGNILAFSDDDQFPLLRSIEDERKDKTGWDKSAIFTKATIRPFRQVNHADTAEDALQICLNHKLRVDLPYMSFLTGKEPEELVRELDTRIYLNPQKYYGNPLEGWELAEEYLSGHVRDKLLYARQKAAEEPELFARNVEALEEVQPEPLTPADIEVNMGAIWVPIEYYRQFMYETFQTSGYEKVIEGGDNRHRIDIEYFSYTTTWRVTNKNAEPDSVMVNQTFGTKRKNAYEIFEDCLNMQSSTVRDRQEYINENGNKSVKYVINAQETMIARAKQQQIQEAFASWVWKEPERRDTLLRIYNETFNTVRPREFDGSHLVFPGMNTEMKLRKHQLDFAARVIYTGTGLAAHEVGAGKTAALIAAGMYLKNLGAIHKAVFVVPNPLVGQWATEFYRFFPNANLLVSTAEDFTPKNRNRYISKIATGEYDAVILAHSQFEKIPISTERQIAMLERQINDIENAIYEIKSENGENWSVKQMVIFRKNLDERLKKLSAEEKKDNLLTFEQLGVDMMMVDEAHFFKNCFVFTKLRNVAGITTSSSQRAFDMLLKCQYLQETNQGRGVVFATGTPISNSISELFVMQRYLQPQELERFGWSYFDTWIAHFAKRTSVLELKPEGGGYRMRDRFVRFYNLPELMAVFREVADIKTADMLDIPGLPAVRTGKAEIVSVEATPAQQAIMADFIMRAEAIRTGRVKPEEDNMLKLTGEARLMAIDPRLIRPDADGTGSKLSVCIEDVYQVWKDTAASASTQLVFCDVGTPKAGKFNVYNEIRNVLLAKGVPESEIAFVHDATSEAQRQELFERTRQGKVRILIGSTSKLGTGVNVQNKVISIDHLDCPWKPSDITQRNGRGVRQGNENPEIMIKQFVAKGTFDAYLWQIQEQKLRYITQILTGKHIARSCEDVDETVLSAAQFKAAATDNPMVAQKMELENRVTELKILRGAWSNEQLSLERKISTIYPGQIKRYEKEIDQIGEDIKLLNQSAGSDFSIVLDGKRYTERSEAGEAFGLLYRMIKEGAKDDSEEFEIGAYRSFPLYLSVGYVSRLVLRYNHHYTTEVGTSALGAITRIEHLAERIPGYLKEAQRELEEVQKQLAVAQQQVGQPFIYEDELSEKVAQLTEINTKLEFESLQESEVILDENGQRSDGEEDWDSERVPSCASAEV